MLAIVLYIFRAKFALEMEELTRENRMLEKSRWNFERSIDPLTQEDSNLNRSTGY